MTTKTDFDRYAAEAEYRNAVATAYHRAPPGAVQAAILSELCDVHRSFAAELQFDDLPVGA